MANENKIKSYKDIVDRDTIFGRIKGTPIKPENNILNVATKIVNKGREFVLPERGFDLTLKNDLTLNGQKKEIPDIIGKNFAQISTKEKLKGIGRYGAEILALPEAIGNLVLSGVSKATKIGEVKDSALQKKLLELATPKTKGEAETMRALDVLSLITPAGAYTKPFQKASRATAPTVVTKKIPVVPGSSGPTNIPISTPSKRYAEYRKKMGYEPYIPQEQLPTIEMGRKPQTTTGLPIIQTEPKISQSIGDTILEPIKQTTNEIIDKGRQAPSLIASTPTTAKPEIDLSVPAKESLETIQPVISQNIETQAISQKIADKFEDIPNVPKMNMKESIDNAVNLSDLDFEKAKRVALGDEKPPTNTEIGFVYEAVKEKAIKNNDWQLLRELATNPNAAPTQATRAGQIVKSFDTLNDSTDPVELMQKVVDSRKKGISLIKKNEVAKSTRLIKDSLEKAKPKKNDWVEFINSIEC